jgi:hypothetical protein
MRRFLKYYDKILLALGVLVFLGSGAVATSRFKKLDEIASRNPAAGIEPARYEVEHASVPVIVPVSWDDAPAQSRGQEWLYDVFTPPVIYYNAQTASFTVTPPTNAAPVAATRSDTPYDIELLSVRQEPYRIQLVGYVGASDNPIATFEIVDTGETVVGRPGKHFEKQEFTLKSFDLRRVVTPAGEGMPVVENVAVAVVIDDRSGREEVLTNRERKMMPRLQAQFRLNVYPGETRLVREGGTIEANGQVYLVTQLSLHPPQAVVSRRSRDALGPAESRTLSPASSPGAESRGRGVSGVVPFPE